MANERTPDVAVKQQHSDLAAQLAEATAKLAAAESRLVKAGVTEEIEAETIARMRGGLDRETAMTCARRQALHNQALAEGELLYQNALKNSPPAESSDPKEIAEAKRSHARGIREAYLSKALVVAASA